MMLTGSSPWRGRTDSEVRDEILEAQPCLTGRFSELSEDAQSFIRGLLNANARDRLDAQSALLHPFVVNRERRFVDLTVLDNLRRFAEKPSLCKLCDYLA